MKALLAKLTFARVMIIASLLGSCVLGWFIYQNQQKIRQATIDLAEEGPVATLVREIQSLSKRYTKLYQSQGDEKLRAQANPQSYIDGIASDEKVMVGRVDIKIAERDLTSSISDKIYSVSPFEKDAVFGRDQIANFFWKLEADSRRVRITELAITALNDQGKPRVAKEEYPSDKWSFNCKITSRQRKGGEAP